MRVINIVDRLDRVNFGIWNAAIATAAELKKGFGIDSEIWYPEWTRESGELNLNGALPRPLARLDHGFLEQIRTEAALDPLRDVIVTHGCWQYPSRWGKTFKLFGFNWVAVPHGMLEAWSLSQKRLRKGVYYKFVERPALLRADRIRAVGKPEFDSLQRRFGDKTVWIPNGVRSLGERPGREKPATKTVLFMARLHHKKGILPLLKGWRESPLCNHPEFVLKIAGPDDGELAAMKAFLDQHAEIRNIAYVGAVYGQDKERLLGESHFYILPSFSEGFPTSVLEAMQYGLVPVVSAGCNFPDIFENRLGIRVEPESGRLLAGLEAVAGLSDTDRSALSSRARDYIEKHYTHSIIARRQAELYRRFFDHPSP